MIDDESLSLEEVIQVIMRRTGKTRRQARMELQKKIRSGDLPMYAENIKTGEMFVIPPESIKIDN